MAHPDDERDYRALVAASFDADDPDDPEIHEALLVHADRMIRDDDPRGPLITLVAARDARSIERAHRIAIDREIATHAVVHGETLFGALAPQLEVKRALRFKWRGGYVHSAYVDVRYMELTQLTPAEFVARVLQAPVLCDVRQLYIRARSPDHVRQVLKVARQQASLEMLSAGISWRPARVGTRDAGLGRVAETHPAGTLAKLVMLGIDDDVVPLPIESITHTLEQMITAVTHAPIDRRGHTIIGRALCAPEPTLRAAALARIAAMGLASRRYIEFFELLLSPDFMRGVGVRGPIGSTIPIIDCIERLGSHAAPLAPTLAAMTGRVDYYDQATRERAGRALRDLTAR